MTTLHLSAEKPDLEIAYLSFDFLSNILLIVFIGNNIEDKSSAPHWMTKEAENLNAEHILEQYHHYKTKSSNSPDQLQHGTLLHKNPAVAKLHQIVLHAHHKKQDHH